MERSLRIIIVARTVILLFFLVVIAFFNIPRILIGEPGHYISYFQALSFINGAIWILFVIGILSITSGIFWYLRFPYKNAAPFISAILTLFSVELLYRFFLFIEKTFIESGFDPLLRKYYILIFIFSLIIGGIKLLNRFRKIRLKELYKKTLEEQGYVLRTRKGKEEISYEEEPEEESVGAIQEGVYGLVEKVVAGMISFIDALSASARK